MRRIAVGLAVAFVLLASPGCGQRMKAPAQPDSMGASSSAVSAASPQLGIGALTGLTEQEGFFFLGSTRETVVSVMGQPDRGATASEDGGYQASYWGRNMVGFDAYGRVTVFQDNNNTSIAIDSPVDSPSLVVSALVPETAGASGTVVVGSTIADVLAIVGVPQQAAWHEDGTADFVYYSQYDLVSSSFVFDARGVLTQIDDDIGLLQK